MGTNAEARRTQSDAELNYSFALLGVLCASALIRFLSVFICVHPWLILSPEKPVTRVAKPGKDIAFII
jgi:hypothetical protein